jgi:hypothetical protein
MTVEAAEVTGMYMTVAEEEMGTDDVLLQDGGYHRRWTSDLVFPDSDNGKWTEGTYSVQNDMVTLTDQSGKTEALYARRFNGVASLWTRHALDHWEKTHSVDTFGVMLRVEMPSDYRDVHDRPTLKMLSMAR